MKKIKSLIAVASVVGITASVSAKTIALWHFDEGVAPNNASTLSSEYNSAIMMATAGTYGEGSLPYFSDDIELPYLAEGASGALISTNQRSLKFTNAGLPGSLGSESGGALIIPYNEIMVMSNLTAEAFVKMDRLVEYPLIIGQLRSGGNTTWNIDMTENGEPRLRIDSNPTGDTDREKGWNQECRSHASINDGRWHHIAFTYAYATKTARIYVDYKEKSSMTTVNNMVYEGMELRIGQGCGGRAFDGWIDEVRLSDEVLLPQHFLMIAPPVGDTYCYWGFDGVVDTYADKLTNRVFANPFVELMHGTAGTLGEGGVKPMFISELPSSTKTFIQDGIDGELINSNSTALFFRNSASGPAPNSGQGSVVGITGPFVPDFPTNLTVEAFIKADRSAQWPQIIGKKRSNGGDFSWSLGVEPNGMYRCRFDTTNPADPNDHDPNRVFYSGVNVYDGGWHHVAMTYHTPTKTVKLYVDYELRETGTTPFPMYLDDGIIQIGAGDQAFDGAIDEVRITKRVLQPSEFLYLALPPPPIHPPRTILLVQ